MNENTYEVSAATCTDGTIGHVGVSKVCQTVEDAKSEAASFPKWMKVYATTLSGSERGSGIIGMHVCLHKDDVNGGVNETGIKRLRKFLSMVSYKMVANFGNSANEEQLKKALGL